MSGHLCFSVGKFFSHCNWQGYIRRLEQQLHAQALSKAVGAAMPAQRQGSWQCLPVNDFFSRYDWQGYSATVEEETKPSLAEAAGVKVAQLEARRSQCAHPNPNHFGRNVELQSQSWQCLGVEDFFSRYDWQGQPRQWQSKHPSKAAIAETTSERHLDPVQCLPVQEFFARCDWGDHAEPEALTTAEPSSSLAELASELVASYQPAQGSVQDWQCQSVQAFFGESNWKGRSTTPRPRQQNRSSSPFTLPMGEFFELFIWSGKPQIAVPPKQTTEFIPARSPELKLASLSELF